MLFNWHVFLNSLLVQLHSSPLLSYKNTLLELEALSGRKIEKIMVHENTELKKKIDKS